MAQSALAHSHTLWVLPGAWQRRVNTHVEEALDGVKALARWPSAAGGMIGPARFVPAMEAAEVADAWFLSWPDRWHNTWLAGSGSIFLFGQR